MGGRLRRSWVIESDHKLSVVELEQAQREHSEVISANEELKSELILLQVTEELLLMASMQCLVRKEVNPAELLGEISRVTA